MDFKVNNKFIFDKCEYVITSVASENVHYHDDFEKSKELIFRVRTNLPEIEFIIFKNSDRIVLNKSLSACLSELEINKIKSLKVKDEFVFNSHNFKLNNILDVPASELGVGKSYIFTSDVSKILKFSLSVTFYSKSDVLNSFLLEIRDLNSFDFTFLD